MDAPVRRRAAIFVVPLIIGTVSARQAAPNVRLVDFVLRFASGILVGMSLMGLIQLLRTPRNPGA
jgi:hypothetical protein